MSVLLKGLNKYPVLFFLTLQLPIYYYICIVLIPTPIFSWRRFATLVFCLRAGDRGEDTHTNMYQYVVPGMCLYVPLFTWI